MIVDAPCKFCKRVVHVEVDDDYTKLHDPFKLMHLLACNKCGDYMVARGHLFDKVKKTCMRLFAGQVGKDDLPKTREHLTALIQRYMRLIADHRDLPMPDWDNALLDDLMSKPGNYSLILAMVPRMFSQPTLV